MAARVSLRIVKGNSGFIDLPLESSRKLLSLGSGGLHKKTQKLTSNLFFLGLPKHSDLWPCSVRNR